MKQVSFSTFKTGLSTSFNFRKISIYFLGNRFDNFPFKMAMFLVQTICNSSKTKKHVLCSDNTHAAITDSQSKNLLENKKIDYLKNETLLRSLIQK